MKRILILILQLLIFISILEAKNDFEYKKESFIKDNESINSFLDEVFEDKNLSIPPTKIELKKVGFKNISNNSWIKKENIFKFNQIVIPKEDGLYFYKNMDKYQVYKIGLREYEKLNEIEVFKRYSQYFGDIFYDYSIDGIKMSLIPQDIRIKYKDRYLIMSVFIYGFDNHFKRNYIKIVIYDYTSLVQKANL